MEACHSRARDTPQQKPDAGIKKFTTKVHEGKIWPQSKEDEMSELKVAHTSNHTNILVLSSDET